LRPELLVDGEIDAQPFAMNTALWIVQGLLAAAFFIAGSFKALAYERAKKQLPWVSDVSRGLVLFIGVSELAGGIGIIGPWATGIMPRLSAVAALGLVAVMLLAAIFHARRKEFGAIVPNLVLGGLAAFVAWGRSGL
jgi:hypothetical protein